MFAVSLIPNFTIIINRFLVRAINYLGDYKKLWKLYQSFFIKNIIKMESMKKHNMFNKLLIVGLIISVILIISINILVNFF